MVGRVLYVSEGERGVKNFGRSRGGLNQALSSVSQEHWQERVPDAKLTRIFWKP